MIGIAERQRDGEVRDATIGLPVREVIFTSPEPGSPFPAEITDAVTRLREQAESRPGSMLRPYDNDDETCPRPHARSPTPRSAKRSWAASSIPSPG
jgi:hypothetical protein